MVFAVASKRAPMAAGLLKNLLLAAPSSSSLVRRLGTGQGAPPFHGDIYYYYEAPIIGNDLFFSHPQLVAPYHFFHTLFTSAAHAPGPARRWWVSKQDEDAVEVKVAMLGMPKERVKVSTNKNGLFVKAESIEDDKSGESQDTAPYSCLIELSADEFDLGKARAEMKGGLLKLSVPRVMVDAIDIKVE